MIKSIVMLAIQVALHALVQKENAHLAIIIKRHLKTFSFLKENVKKLAQLVIIKTFKHINVKKPLLVWDREDLYI
jgi:hypothetical protein